MFWNKKNNADRLDSLRILQWWRTPQEYVPWIDVDLKEPFGTHFSQSSQHVFVEFDDEASLISTVWELKSVMDELWKQAEKKKAEYVQKNRAELLLKSTSIGPNAFVVKPFFQDASFLTFGPPKLVSSDVFLTLFFHTPSDSLREFDQRLAQWMQVLQADVIDRFVYRRAVELFQELLNAQAKQTDFDALINIKSHFESVILKADQQISQDYLKKVWRIPMFVFANQPEQAALTRLLLQKSFQEQQSNIALYCEKMYWGQFLHWLLFRRFDAKEEKSLRTVLRPGDTQPVFMDTELWRFYKQLIQRCGVPVELGELYGTHEYVSRVLQTFSQFPKTSVSESELAQGELYAVLLKETVRFGMRHTKEITASPNDLLKVLIGIMVGRLAKFQEKQKES